MRHGKLRQICPYKQKTMEKRNWFKNKSDIWTQNHF